MQKEVKKTYLGCVEVPDNLVNKCIDNNEDLVIVYKGDRMRLTTPELTSREVKLHNSHDVYPGTKGGKSYRLVAFKWNPDEIDL